MVDSECWRHFMVLHRMVKCSQAINLCAAGHGKVSAGLYLESAEVPPFLAIGPMDKNAQLHWTF
jgi:hypothetical protein